MNWPSGNWTHSLSFLGISLTVSGVVSQVNGWERKPWNFGGYPSSESWTRWGYIWFLTYHLGDLIAPPRVLSTENKPNLEKHPLGCLMCRSHSNKSVAINFVKRNGKFLPHASKNKIKQTNKWTKNPKLIHLHNTPNFLLHPHSFQCLGSPCTSVKYRYLVIENACRRPIASAKARNADKPVYPRHELSLYNVNTLGPTLSRSPTSLTPTLDAKMQG